VKESRSILTLVINLPEVSLSSPAGQNMAEMVSIRTIESILLLLEIEPSVERFSEWLDSKIKLG
jgi:hypothetical protein